MRAARAVTVLVVAGLSVTVGQRASAACHSFTVSASSPVTEGNKVTVTVKRDGSLRPSSVQIRTVNGTALAGGDYQATIRRIFFESDTSQTLQIATTEDNVRESDESFQIKLENAQGCEVTREYVYGPPATVTIKDDDGANATSPPTRTPTRTSPPSSASATLTPSPSASATPTGSASPTPASTESQTPVAAPAEKSKGLSPPLAVLAIVAFGLALAGAVLAARMRRAASARRPSGEP